MTIAPVLKYPGSKWRLARWIIGHLPPHSTYLEPFFGSGAVFFRKPPSKVETVNDLDGDVVNLFRVCREQPGELAAAVRFTPWSRAEHRLALDEPRTGEPVEDARRFLVRAWQSFGGRHCWRAGWRHSTGRRARTMEGGLIIHSEKWRRLPEGVLAIAERLMGVQIECLPALELIARYRYPGCAIYADPPYPFETRADKYDRFYRHELRDDDHLALLDALDAHPGPVLLSGYRCALYDERLAHWQVRMTDARAEMGKARREALWLNGAAVAGLGARQLALPVAAEGRVG